MFAHGFSSSILIREPRSPLALKLFPGGLIVPASEGSGARGGTSTKTTGPATSALWMSFGRKERITL